MEMKLKFTGHDTFPLRYGWPYKAVNSLFKIDNYEMTTDDIARKAIVNLGVGKNMVNAIKYWADMTGIVDTRPVGGKYLQEISQFGRFLFDVSAGSQSAVDPYLEDVGSIWLLHFNLNFRNDALTSYRYFFNYSNFQTFEKNKLVDEIYTESSTLTGFEPGKKSTVKKDVDCFLHTYTKKTKSSKAIDEDYFASPLAELGLVREVSNGNYICELSERTTIPASIFGYALCQFILRETRLSNVSHVDFDSILTKPGSPGRIFRLSETGLSRALDELVRMSKNNVSWIDSLGSRQISISELYKSDPEHHFLLGYYGGGCAYY